MKRVRIATFLLTCCLTGCLPAKLDTNNEGRLLIPRQEGYFLYDPRSGELDKVHGPGGGRPVHALFSPSGKDLLLIAKDRRDFVDEYRFDLKSLKSGKVRTICWGREVADVKFSPNGDRIAFVQYDKVWAKANETSLYMVDVKTGVKQLVLKSVSPSLHWFADGKRLLIFFIDRVEDSEYRGVIAIHLLASGKTLPLVNILGRRQSSMDLSPDNRKVVFTANRTGAVGVHIFRDRNLETNLFELDIARQAVRPLHVEAKYVRYSPGGKRVLLTRRSKQFGFGKQDLVVADAGLTNLRTITTEAFTPVIALSPQQHAFPGWIDDDRLFYFSERMTYGTHGKAVHLVLIGADGQNKRYVQPDIDLAVERVLAAPK